MPQTEAAASNRLAVGMTWRAVVVWSSVNPRAPKPWLTGHLTGTASLMQTLSPSWMTTRRARWARVVRRVLRRLSKRCSAPLQSSWESLGEMLGNIDRKKRIGRRKNPSQEALNQQLEHLMNCSMQPLIGLPERLGLGFWIQIITAPGAGQFP